MMNDLWVTGTHVNLRENLEMESGFLKGTVFHPDFIQGDYILRANVLRISR